MKIDGITTIMVSIAFIFAIFAFSPYVQLFIINPAAFVTNWIYLLIVIILFGATYYAAKEVWVRSREKRWFVYYVLLTVGVTLSVVYIASDFIFQKESVQFTYIIQFNDSMFPSDTVHFICRPIDTDLFIVGSRIECEASALSATTLNELTLRLKMNSSYTNLSEGFEFEHTQRQGLDYFTSQGIIVNPGVTSITTNITIPEGIGITPVKMTDQITVLEGQDYLKKIFLERAGLIAAIFLFSVVSLSGAIKNIRDLYQGT